MTPVTVHKLDLQGQETWRYDGQMLSNEQGCILLEAYFDREDMDLHGLPIKRGDRFLETWYTDRWYNIFEIHGREDGQLSGWYCNIGQPARLKADQLSYVDLALDLLVFPDGRQLVLDEEEFDQLELRPEIRAQALAALAELQQHFRELLPYPD